MEKPPDAEVDAIPPAEPVPEPPLPATPPTPVAVRDFAQAVHAPSAGFRPAHLFGTAAVILSVAALVWVVLQAAGGGDAGATEPADGGDATDDGSTRSRSWTVGTAVEADAEAPPAPLPPPDHEALPWRGAEDPIVAMVEFGDYECRHTREAEETIGRVIERFAPDVRLLWVHNPHPIHEHARLAAEAAEAARMQGRFGEMHARLMDARGRVDRGEVVRLARGIGLDVGRFERDLDGPAREAVARMIAFAGSKRLSATPHFLIGDRIVAGAMPEETFAAAVEAAIEKARARLAQGKSRREVFREAVEAAGWRR